MENDINRRNVITVKRKKFVILAIVTSLFMVLIFLTIMLVIQRVRLNNTKLYLFNTEKITNAIFEVEGEPLIIDIHNPDRYHINELNVYVNVTENVDGKYENATDILSSVTQANNIIFVSLQPGKIGKRQLKLEVNYMNRKDTNLTKEMDIWVGPGLPINATFRLKEDQIKRKDPLSVYVNFVDNFGNNPLQFLPVDDYSLSICRGERDCRSGYPVSFSITDKYELEIIIKELDKYFSPSDEISFEVKYRQKSFLDNKKYKISL
jgi:hypothetical protein